MDLRVQRLDAAVHHLGKAGQIGDVAHRPAPPRASPWRCRRSRPARPRAGPERGRDRRGRSCPTRTAGRGGSSPDRARFLLFPQFGRRNIQAMAVPSAGLSPLIDELLRFAAAAPRRRSRDCPRSTSLPPRQRNCQTVAPRTPQQRRPGRRRWSPPRRRGARWKRIGEAAPPAPSVACPIGDQAVLAAQLAPVRGEGELAPMDEAEAADIAVMARLDDADAGGLVAAPARPGRRPCRGCRRRGSRSNCGRRASASNGPRVVRSALTSSAGSASRASADAAAIDDDPAWPIRQLEGEGRGAAAGEDAARRRRRGVEDDDRVLAPRAADSPSRAPDAAAGCERRSPRARRGGGASSPYCRPASSTAPRRRG